MQVILLERIENLGQMGDVVTVKPGYARNFLLPRAKALRATKDNVTYFEGQKKILEAESLKKREEAEKVAKKADGTKIVVIRQASEGGQLYGSVSSRDIVEAAAEKGLKISRQQVQINTAFKLLGLYPVKVFLHPEVAITLTVNIARSVEEAKLQEEKGGALIRNDNAAEDLATAAVKAVEETEAPAAEATPAAEGEVA